MTNLFNYDLVQAFNYQYYKDKLDNIHISDSEKFVSKVKDEVGEEEELNLRVFPMKKNNKNYLLPRDFLKELPIEVLDEKFVSINKDGYYLITDRVPTGLRPTKMYDTNFDFLKDFCKFEHSNQRDFTLYKIIMLTALIKRLNVRISTNPGFGKDSISNVLRLITGNIGVVHNPTMAKIEYLLTNKILVTNEVAGIKADDRTNLEQYYLLCGDFNNVYEKRSIANYKGTQNTYDIGKLSNIVFYNNIDCYPSKKQDKYFDKMFQRAVRERFLPFKFSGRITEQFTEVLNKEKVALENKDFYKKIIKHLNYLTDNFDSEVHGYEHDVEVEFSDRWLRNWNTIVTGIDVFTPDEETFKFFVRLLYDKYRNYVEMIEEFDRLDSGLEPPKPKGAVQSMLGGL